TIQGTPEPQSQEVKKGRPYDKLTPISRIGSRTIIKPLMTKNMICRLINICYYPLLPHAFYMFQALQRMSGQIQNLSFFRYHVRVNPITFSTLRAFMITHFQVLINRLLVIVWAII